MDHFEIEFILFFVSIVAVPQVTFHVVKTNERVDDSKNGLGCFELLNLKVKAGANNKIENQMWCELCNDY